VIVTAADYAFQEYGLKPDEMNHITAKLHEEVSTAAAIPYAGSLAAALERMLLMGELLFSGTQVSALVKLKLNPLLCGPTGVGKTHLVQEVASRLKAKYFRVTRSDWLVVGCRQGRPSVY